MWSKAEESAITIQACNRQYHKFLAVNFRVLCSRDIASSNALLQEGIIGSQQPAVLLREREWMCIKTIPTHILSPDSSCSCDIASSSALLWEGIMGSRQPAVLLRETVNVEQCGEQRKERLSTGRYTLVDIKCRGCSKKLGWHYLEARSPVSFTPVTSTHTQADSAFMDIGYPWRCLDVTLLHVADRFAIEARSYQHFVEHSLSHEAQQRH